LRKTAQDAEAELKRLWQERNEIDARLAAPNGDAAKAGDLMRNRGEVERRIATAEQRWLEASEAAERASAS
jgi:ATP-binding cassette, subfamily F, member 3